LSPAIQEQQRRILDRLASRRDILGESALVHLIEAVLLVSDEELACAECRAHLPIYVDDEMAGLANIAGYTPVRRHLILCPSCSAVYVDLLEVSLLEERGALPRPSADDAPDLSFLN
jgi:hypothetical protein